MSDNTTKTSKFGRKVQQLIDLINQQQTEMQALKNNDNILRAGQSSILDRLRPDRTLLSAMVV